MTINIGISQSHREYARDLLFKILSDYYILMIKTQNYHWNARGPHFHNYHQMLELQYNDLAQGVDLLAERIRSLGFHVPANYKNFMTHATLQEEMREPATEDMLKNLIHDHEYLIRETREAINKLKETGDENTLDLLVERLSLHEKTAWMLRSLNSHDS